MVREDGEGCADETGDAVYIAPSDDYSPSDGPTLRVEDQRAYADHHIQRAQRLARVGRDEEAREHLAKATWWLGSPWDFRFFMEQIALVGEDGDL